MPTRLIDKSSAGKKSQETSENSGRRKKSWGQVTSETPVNSIDMGERPRTRRTNERTTDPAHHIPHTTHFNFFFSAPLVILNNQTYSLLHQRATTYSLFCSTALPIPVIIIILLFFIIFPIIFLFPVPVCNSAGPPYSSSYTLVLFLQRLNYLLADTIQHL